MMNTEDWVSSIRDEQDRNIAMGLRAAYPALSEKGRSFAASLMNGQWGLRARGYLTANQRAAALKMLSRSSESRPAPEARAVSLGDLGSVFAFYDAAKAKHPTLTFDVNGNTVEAKLAGNRSKYAGSLVLTNGEPYGSDTARFYGVVRRSGEWEVSRWASDALQVGVVHLFRELASDPQGTVVARGKSSGRCCMCYHKLTDGRSTHIGMGPVCAKKWGMHEQWKAGAASLPKVVIDRPRGRTLEV